MGQRAGNDRNDRSLLRQAHAPISGDEVCQPRYVPGGERSVEAERAPCDLEFGFTCAGRYPKSGRVTGREVDQEERDRHDK